MKYLLLFLFALLIIWQWRTHRGNKSNDRSSQRRSKLPIDMVPCADCGVHLALQDAVQGKDGMYCSAAHRQRHEH
jgi:uncharacterized protein